MRYLKMHWQNSILSLLSKMYNPKQDAMKIGTRCIPVANIAFLVTGSYTYRFRNTDAN